MEMQEEAKIKANVAARKWCKTAIENEYVWCIDQNSWYTRAASGVWERDRLNMVRGEIIKAASKANPSDTGAWARYFQSVAECFDGLVINSEDWDAHMWAFGAPDDVYDLIEGTHIDRLLDLQITKRVGVRPGGKTTLWEAFLLEAARGDAEVVSFLKRWAGYSLSGSTKEHCILFIHGPGGNGKSVFVDTIRYAWGEYAKTLPMDALMESKGDRHPAEIAMLKGARLAIANETQEGRKWDDAKLKQLTGGDVVVARHMRQDWFEFAPVFKLLVVGNHAPQIAVVDDAMRRRLCMVPFTNRPATPDPDLGAKLREEAGGVLRWAMEGFEEWSTLGGLRPPESILKATAGYLDDQDTVGAWLQDCTIKNEGSFVSSAHIMASWSHWCREAGTHPKSMKRLGPDLKGRGYVQTRTEHARGFLGLTLLTHPDTLADAS
jgi:putative DNA primase/helicase